MVTGATGFIGRHVVRQLLCSGRRIVVLVRPRAGLTAAERIAQALGNLSREVELLEGDLAYPGILEQNLGRLRSTIHTVFHCAGETSFMAGQEDATRIVQIEGPLALLKMLQARGLQRWSHMSTAFVCGRRSGIVRENELGLGQEFHNSYERLKLEAELIFTQACQQLGIELRIFRPTIVIGSSANTTNTMGALPSSLFFAFLCLLMAASRKPGAVNTIVRLKAHPRARFNIVPLEYVTTAVDRLTDSPEASGKTFHLAVPNPPTQQTMLQMIGDCLRLRNLHLLGPEQSLSNPSPLELRLAKLMLPYREYMEQDVQFDCLEARHLLKAQNVEPPVIDSREVDRLMALVHHNAHGTRFAKA